MRTLRFLLRRTSRSWLRNALAAAVAIGLGLFAAVITSTHSTPAQAADPVVTIRAFTFQGTLTVAPGATVTVVNADTVSHTLTAVDNSFTTPVIPAGGSATFKAPVAPGAYAIKCNIHASMSGTLTVSAAATPSPSPSVTPRPTPSPTPTASTIMIMNFAYSGDLTVAPGATVTVVNMDAVSHTLTAADNTFTTPVIPAGGTATFRAPTAPGTYAIKCNIHSFMAGTLTVSTTRPTTPPATTPPPSAGPTIMIMGFAYSGDLTVAPGATVTVVNMDAVSHTLTAVDNTFTTPVIPAGGRATFVAPLTPGAHAIKCNIHASMSGTLTVTTKPSPPPTPTSRPTATPRPTR